MSSQLTQRTLKNRRATQPSVWWLLLLLLAFVGLPMPSTAAALLTDTTPPKLTSFQFGQSSVDVSAAAATVTGTAHVTDDLSGYLYGFFYLSSPTYGQVIYSYFKLVAGTLLDGDAEFTVEIPKDAEAGDWYIGVVVVGDKAGNRQSLDSAALAKLNFPTKLSVISSAQDVTPPELTAFSFTPAAIDVSSGPQATLFTLGINDSQSGVELSSCTTKCENSIGLVSPSGRQLQFEMDYNYEQVTGTSQSGVWQIKLTLPQYAEPGNWQVAYIVLHDVLGNSRSYSTADLRALGFPVDLAVSSSPSDTEPPRLTSFNFSPTFVDTTTGARQIILSAGLADNLSCLNFANSNVSPNLFNYSYFRFASPSGGQNLYFGVRDPRVSGTVLNGTWQATAYLPQYSEAGTWTMVDGYFSDGAGNRANYSSAQLNALGFPTTFQVILPSLIVDGTVPATGGTVMDDVFGSRAVVTIPPGVLTQPATVSIDVLSTALHLPIPSGFTTNGTNFVSIHLVPAPTPPFLAPGLTIVLPLLNQMAPGTPLTLYRVDPGGSGNLIPEPGIGGGPAMGTVDASGLSATFTGVASLSTVVGLIRSNAVLGDLDGDGKVNCADVAIVRRAFGKRLRQAGFDSRADTNRDNVVNVRDLAYVSRALPRGLVCRITPTGAITVQNPSSTTTLRK